MNLIPRQLGSLREGVEGTNLEVAYVKDLTVAMKQMNDLGFEQLAPIGNYGEGGIVFYFDPDGIKVQISGPLTKKEPSSN